MWDTLEFLIDFAGPFVTDGDLSAEKNGNFERYRWLMKFLGGESVDKAEVREAIDLRARSFGVKAPLPVKSLVKPGREPEVEDEVVTERIYQVNGRSFTVDYTSVPEGVPLGKYFDERSITRYKSDGVRLGMESAFKFLDEGLRLPKAWRWKCMGRSFGNAPVGVREGSTYRKVRTIVESLLRDVLAVNGPCVYAYDNLEKKRRIEVYEIDSLGGGVNGRRAYMVHSYDLYKVKNKPERRVINNGFGFWLVVAPLETVVQTAIDEGFRL